MKAIRQSRALADHHDLPLALLHDLVPLVHQGYVEEDDALAGFLGLALVGHLLLDADGVADLDLALEVPGHAEESDGGAFLNAEAAFQAGGDGEAGRAVQDAAAEDRRLSEFL